VPAGQEGDGRGEAKAPQKSRGRARDLLTEADPCSATFSTFSRPSSARPSAPGCWSPEWTSTATGGPTSSSAWPAPGAATDGQDEAGAGWPGFCHAYGASGAAPGAWSAGVSCTQSMPM